MKGFVYSIKYFSFSFVNGKVLYVGSCIDLDRRQKQHKCSFKTQKGVGRLYKTLKELDIDWDDLFFEILEEYDNIETKDLRKREIIYIQGLTPYCNTEHNIKGKKIDVYKMVKCKVCDKYLNKYDLKRHNRTKKHLKNIQ